MARLGRWSQAWATGAPLIVPCQREAYRVVSASWLVTASTPGDVSTLAIINGSGEEIFRAAALQTAGGDVKVCFNVNDLPWQLLQNQTAGAPVTTYQAGVAIAPGHLPPDLVVLPNERLQLENPGMAAGTQVIISMLFPDEPMNARRFMTREADGKVRPRKK